RVVLYTLRVITKAGELERNPRAALVFYWRPLGQQVRVEGRVERVSEAEAAAYFATGPRGSTRVRGEPRSPRGRPSRASRLPAARSSTDATRSWSRSTRGARCRCHPTGAASGCGRPGSGSGRTGTTGG